jgi:hypothetical protein
MVLTVLRAAEESYNQQMHQSWWIAKANPEAYKARRFGADELARRFTAILTGGGK